ncbi:MAG: peptidase C11 [Oscillospiraceae bacterium]|nr:peptidase C11 [Oscillospiraceae bacterium]
MDQKRPKSREKQVTSGGSGAYRRGSGLGTGPVGSQNGYAGRKTESSGGGGKRAAIGGGGTIALVAAAFMLLKGCNLGSLTNQAGGGDGTTELPGQSVSGEQYVADTGGTADTSVAEGSRAKYTTIMGNSQDTVTMMVYICGTDLESKSGMASSDISEMLSASVGNNINLILYTGGCKQWKSVGGYQISNSTNQIHQIRNGQIRTLEANVGNKVMTDPATLTEFINYCKTNFPANRNELIFWDHGGGSVSGYGYDEKNAKKGSMSLAGINQALKNSNMKFDFIGFDACLMATAETALMLNNYADYLVASEETEPGIGWYYTNWLNKLNQNTSLPTVELGKNIVDDFVTECAKRCPGQKTTLSVIDLAEFANTVPQKLSGFANSVSTLMTNKEYQTVSTARNNTREFATSSKIDQVDLVDLAKNMNTSEGSALADAIHSAVKYNRTSTNMTNAHGVSIYFPYKRTSYVDSACSTFNQIDMDDSYSKCIRQFASLETSGQIAAGGSSASSPISSLFGGMLSGGTSGSSDLIGSLLSGFLGGGGDRSIEGLDSSNTDFMNEGDVNQAAQYIAENHFDPSALTWTENDGKYQMTLSDEQWAMVNRLDKNVFLDDGQGYIDLGLDNLFSFDGNTLIADSDRDWLSVNGQTVAYYHTDELEYNGDVVDSGYIPAFLNGERVKLLVRFDKDHKGGYIVGAETDYRNDETDTVAKSMTEIQNGDKIDFVCDYYTYDGEYKDSYYLGEQLTVSGDLVLSNTDVGSGTVKITYCFTDMYNQEYWSEAIIR